MAADPTLADRLDGRATFCEGYLRELNADPGYYPKDADLDRAAAVRLRKLDAIEAAIGDMDPDMVDSLRKAQAVVRHRLSPSVAEPTLAAAVLIERIADALGGTE